MRQFLFYLLVAIFSIFIGSQITEGALLLPYWKSLSTVEFYAYYSEFGPVIGRFYTVLTIIAALTPIGLSVYCKMQNSSAIRPALFSSFFAVLFVASFYVYFKDANELFYQSALNDAELKNELVTWGNWHWSRILVQLLSLVFLILALVKVERRAG